MALRISPRFMGQPTYYVAVDPYGWQNTGIRLRKGDKFEVFLSGKVSPGFLKNLDAMRKYDAEIVAYKKNNGTPPAPKIPAPEWPFTGPEGYTDKEYARVAGTDKKVLMPSYEKDDGLTVKGLPHNTVVGIVLPDGVLPEEAKPIGNGKSQPGYSCCRDEIGKTDLLLLSDRNYPKEMESKGTGALWVTINDADAFRADNAGMFFMRLKKK